MSVEMSEMALAGRWDDLSEEQQHLNHLSVVVLLQSHLFIAYIILLVQYNIVQLLLYIKHEESVC